MVDVVMNVIKVTSAEEVNEVLKDAANAELRGILAVSEEPSSPSIIEVIRTRRSSMRKTQK
jgi:glyceraldehyde-3-phosphate dehydrogenase/erythrose-4-phosphate dehydrogenase